MLIPRKVKHRKQHHPRQRGVASGGTSVTFGDYGVQALEHAYITNRQIESARIAINRHIKRGGKVWINIFPDRPLTKKPAETRMGSGKGSPEWWVANVKPGRVLFELSYPDEKIARRTDPRDPQVADQGPHRDSRGALLMAVGVSAGDLRELTDEELITKLRESKEELFNLRFQTATGQLTNNHRLRIVRQEIARAYTVLRERELGLASGPGGEDS